MHQISNLSKSVGHFMKPEYDFLKGVKNLYTEKNSQQTSSSAAMNAFIEMRAHAARCGFMTEEEIEAEIAAARRGE